MINCDSLIRKLSSTYLRSSLNVSEPTIGVDGNDPGQQRLTSWTFVVQSYVQQCRLRCVLKHLNSELYRIGQPTDRLSAPDFALQNGTLTSNS
ncbi:hypothetical protein TNCV_2671831 [Trichonephila clavipes]|nr:hypothetical protein TNCV_2671831 [Trichonephila clavipes]